jgi:hypothetical protein
VPGARFGFLVIMSPVELDVTAVYTARPLDGGVSTMDVQVMEPRRQGGAVAAEIPVDIPGMDRQSETKETSVPGKRR